MENLNLTFKVSNLAAIGNYMRIILQKWTNLAYVSYVRSALPPTRGGGWQGKMFFCAVLRILYHLVPILHRLCSVGDTLSYEIAAVHFEGADDPIRRAEDKIWLQKWKIHDRLPPPRGNRAANGPFLYSNRLARSGSWTRKSVTIQTLSSIKGPKARRWLHTIAKYKFHAIGKY